MAIVDATVAGGAGWTMTDLAARFLDGGARLLQVRMKDTPSGLFLDVASAIVLEAHRAGAQVIINDRADIARLSGADGVHVGQEDLAPAAARSIVGPDATVGLSTHTAGQLDVALREPVDYVAIGPVFGTATKDTGYESVGLDRVRAVADRTRRRGMPLVAIGGITLDTAADVIRAGATSVAVISDLVADADPAARVRTYLERLTL